MAELHGINLGLHLESILSEFAHHETIYGYPKRKMFFGFPGLNLSVDFHDRQAATPLGPASGPHTQMAQNILLAWLGGGRIIELKTVQILDQLEIPRPCIDIRNIGYNVEWSQELRLEDSFTEYVTAWILLKILEEMEIFEISKGNPFYDTVFDISVGYDFKGISSPQVKKWLSEFGNANQAIERTLDTLPPKFKQYRNIKINPEISSSVTLSTFHGCPANEIESIVEYLICEHGFHVIVKMNPTILGYDFVGKTLIEDLGYTNIELDPLAFDQDISFEDAVPMMKRLQKFAEKFNRNVGAKFTNTLVVKNNQDIFKDEVMYLSGSPLHVLSMNAMHNFRTAMGPDFHISFSAGINKHNFVDAVRCNMKPVSTCTDLLKEGGYTRLFDYLYKLKEAMENSGCTNIEKFIISSTGNAKIYNIHEAGVTNAQNIVPNLIQNPTYHFEANRKIPRKIDSRLTLFDCITCNKCIPVCPNAANFSIPTVTVNIQMTNYKLIERRFEPIGGESFILNRKNQIANIADFCNECGDCDTYCPEYGGPFIEKPRFFFSEESYSKFNEYDGFYFPTPFSLTGRINKTEYKLSFDVDMKEYIWCDSDVEIVIDSENQILSGKSIIDQSNSIEIDMIAFYIMRTLLDGILNMSDSYFTILLRGIA